MVLDVKIENFQDLFIEKCYFHRGQFFNFRRSKFDYIEAFIGRELDAIKILGVRNGPDTET